MEMTAIVVPQFVADSLDLIHRTWIFIDPTGHLQVWIILGSIFAFWCYGTYISPKK